MVERTARTVLVPGPIEENACIIDGLGDPFTVVVFVDDAAHLIGSRGEFPFVGGQQCDLRLNRPSVVFVDEMRPVGAATVFVLWCQLGEHTGAASAIDTHVVAGHEGDVELPGVSIRVVEGDPLMKIVGAWHPGDRTVARDGYRVDVAGEFDDIRARLELIGEELADLAIVRLRESIDAGGSELPVDEKRLTRARRAVEKAVHLLDEPDRGFD